MSSKPTHLEPSKLGTKEYWDNLYASELQNHASNPRDEGTVWFDDADAESRTVLYLDQLTESATFDHEIRREDASFLDLGCGNGSLLFALREDGWRGPMLGVDYSAASVALARQVAEKRKERRGGDDDDHMDQDEDEDEAGGDQDAMDEVVDVPSETQDDDDEEKEEEEIPSVEFAEWDVLRGPLEVALGGAQAKTGWDVVLDKGTFDAVCLSPEQDAQTGRRVCEGYRARVLRLLKPGGLFLVTSCNWTEDELRAWFEDADTAEVDEAGSLAAVGSIEYPSFQFGGAKGQAISTLCFQKHAKR
ncbi:S-adenosyl-L-methionine-dependent methyltransferase [Sodiomyces alkalinus F11]|uniref:Protein-lysine N-methyltransferase EFM4 n=1 Tax=Sodiomyces alkalinus (strain CBS 110278 / VKM F-3762 / F11) TaxID=1314773 RepID=A0A3N2Q0T5_SODAK|nr:S-adenosyl-L-methionine-dependent methyltransferase [Sodiomyces alkalinus F11]ROT40350.1 S-adenosyl-L-methionine-dependent methyltransferase [Sodiomyces alkalinus F11]